MASKSSNFPSPPSSQWSPLSKCLTFNRDHIDLMHIAWSHHVVQVKQYSFQFIQTYRNTTLKTNMMILPSASSLDSFNKPRGTDAIRGHSAVFHISVLLTTENSILLVYNILGFFPLLLDNEVLPSY